MCDMQIEFTFFFVVIVASPVSWNFQSRVKVGMKV